ncbi:MAG TPA: FHA domain-containing protein [Polyangia bacterium]|jgi:pSer/pThr/pTyr-binding forkhead associated (FHA) protein
MIGDDENTKMSSLPTPTPDDQPTAAHSDVGIVAELRAVFGNGEKKTLPLYALPDQIVVGRGTASDWQLDDPSLSRKHCQFKWNGKLLTVEDLGSANGTRVGAKSARQPTPVGTDDVVQLGTVMVSFVPLRGFAERDGGRNVDAEATKLVSAPIPAGGAGETTPSPINVRPPLSPQATVVKAAPQSGPPNARAAVFHPERDAAGPDDPTRQWDPDAALVHAPERAFDATEMVARVKLAWRTNRRPFVLGGAAIWIALLIALIALKQPKQTDDDDVAVATKSVATPSGASPSGASASGVAVTPSGATPSTNDSAAGDNVVEPSTDRDQDLADAIAAYDNGRPQEALRYFRRLSTDPKDKTAKFMVGLIESRGAATP